MHLEIKNEQLAFLKRFAIAFCLFPTLLFVMSLFDNLEKDISIFAYISASMGFIIAFLYFILHGLPTHMLEGNGETFSIPNASFLRRNRTDITMNKKNLVSTVIERGVENYILVLKMRSMPKIATKNMVLGYIAIEENSTIKLSFFSEKS